jgi:hypothetical protein
MSAAISPVCRHGQTGFCVDELSARPREHFEFLYGHAFNWAVGGEDVLDTEVDTDRAEEAERYAAYYAQTFVGDDEPPSHRVEFENWRTR